MPRALETARLLLRPFTGEDRPLVHSISSDPDTTRYLYFWGRPGSTPASDTDRFLRYALDSWAQKTVRSREYCVILRETGEAIGDASVEICDESTAEIGWILLPAFRGRGYASEAGRAMMDFGFECCGVQRVIAHCDTRNAPSARVMARLGMHLERIEKEGRPAKTEGAPKGDEATWGISRVDWAWGKYRGLSCRFQGFLPLPDLADGDIRLLCHQKAPGDPEKQWVPSYHFHIVRDGERLGGIDLRIGYTDGLFYGGQIGYNIDEAHRGRGYAGRACRLLRPLMRLHGMKTAVITNDVRNAASRRVCEKLGAAYWCHIKLPEDNDMRLSSGMDEVNVYAFPAED